MQLFDYEIIGQPLALSLLVAAGAGLLIQLFYYLFFFLRVTSLSKKTQEGLVAEKPPVSVLICARNEAENLLKFLPQVLEQDYPDFEVIVVNDCSWDTTEEVLARLKEKYSNLYVTKINEDAKFSHGKKLALTIAIKAAKNEILLLTDADCVPASKNWISGMVQHFDDTTHIVLGYGGYSRSGGLLNLLIQFDTIFIALQYLTFARAGLPYMGVGRNLAYRKSLFFAAKGFASHYKLASGDDDLFINQVANRKNTRIEVQPDTFTWSVPGNTFKDWFHQKKRHFTTAAFYRFKHKALLLLEPLSRGVFYVALLGLLSIYPTLIYLIIIAFGARFLLQNLVAYHACKHFKEQRLLFVWWIFDFLLPLVNMFVYLSHFISPRKNRWRT